MKPALSRAIIIAAGFALFCYVAARAYLISFTHDEGLTYMHFMSPPLSDIFNYSYPDPNNHLTNTLLMRLMSRLVPLRDFWLRLPVVLSFLGYLFFAWKLVKNDTVGFRRICHFIILCCIPYLLDFFSMARGYALSFTFMLGSIYFLKRWFETSKTRYFLAVILFGGLAFLSSFVTISFYLALIGVLVLNEIIKSQPGTWKKHVLSCMLIVALSAPLLVYVVSMSLKMKGAGQLYAGTNAGFFNGPLKSIITNLLYLEALPNGIWVIVAPCIVFPILLGTFYNFKTLADKPRTISFSGALILIILISCLSIILQHHVLGVLYVTGRTAFFLAITFMVLIVGLFQNYLSKYRWINPVYGILAGLFLINFLLHANFSYFLETKYDANTKRMLIDLKKYRSNKDSDSLKGLYTYWVYQPASAFYQASEDIGALKQIERFPDFDFSYDYYYVPDSTLYRFRARPLRIIKKYPLTRSVLFESLSPDKKTVYATKSLGWQPDFDTRINWVKQDGQLALRLDSQQFSPSVEFASAELPHDKLLRAEVSWRVWCPKKPGGTLVVTVANEHDSAYLWAGKQLGDQSLAPGKWMHVSFIQNLPQFKPGNSTVKVHLWNTTGIPMYLANLQVIITEQPKYY